MVLLNLPNGKDALDRLMKVLSKMLGIAGGFPQLISKPQRIAQGIDFVLALPYPIGHFSFILGPVFSVRRFVECIGIRVMQDALYLPFYQPCNESGDPIILCGKCKVGLKLTRRIPQPHRGNIAGDNVYASVIGMAYGFFQCPRKQPAEKNGYRRAFGETGFHIPQ